MFYLYATEDIHNIPIYKSPDLVNWTFVGTAFTDATRPTFEPKAGLWAPDINHIDGKYVLYYAMSRWGGEHTCGIGCAVADSPAGPFTDQGKLFRSNEIGVQNSIDPFYICLLYTSSVYKGKVRDVYDINDEYLVMVVSDRISAFDVILPEGVPYKGQVLNQIASKFLDATADIVPNWKIATPDPMVTVGHKCEPFKVEMVIRGYLTGSSWRSYKSGERTLCGLPLPEGMRENQKFDSPLITPTTKADEGPDENISKEDVSKSQITISLCFSTVTKDFL